MKISLLDEVCYWLDGPANSMQRDDDLVSFHFFGDRGEIFKLNCLGLWVVKVSRASCKPVYLSNFEPSS